jgi:hypothetical protein
MSRESPQMVVRIAIKPSERKPRQSSWKVARRSVRMPTATTSPSLTPSIASGRQCRPATTQPLAILELEEDVLRQLGALGWWWAILPKSRLPGLDRDRTCVDFSGGPLYAGLAARRGGLPGLRRPPHG